MSTLLARFVARADDHPAIVDADGTHTYRGIVRGAEAVASSLLADRSSLDAARIGLLAQPGASFVAGFFGILLAGGTVVVLSPLHPAPETRYFCDDADVRAVLVSAELDPLARAVFAASELALLPLEALLGEERPRVARVASPSDDAPALQLYTSGTTGKPKGAIITHKNLALQQELVGNAWGFSPKDTLLHALPLHHMHGLAIALLTALGHGATVRMLTFDARAVWEALSSATVFMGVPSMYHRLLLAFDRASDAERAAFTRAARDLRLATSGSAALPVTFAERWRALTGKIPLERFGMTEIGVGMTNELDGARYPGCVGFPLPTVETRIVDDEGRDAELGELWIRGPSVFAGYHRRAAETDAAFAVDPAGGPRWFRTGDTVTREVQSDGRAPFKILGRTSVDILKSGGYKLSALEIEEALREHPSVGEVAVVGVPDEAWGERVVACLVLRSGAPPCDDVALKAFCKARLAVYKIPKEFVFLEDLPKNVLGKVVKPSLISLISPQT